MKKSNKIERNPFVMLVASIIWLAGAAIVVIAVMNYSAFGWWTIPLIASGLSSMGFATATIVTGKPEWILLDMILPG